MPLFSNNGRVSPAAQAFVVLTTQPSRPGNASDARMEDAPTLARRLSGGSQGAFLPSPNGHQRPYARSTFKSLGSISGQEGAAQIASPPQISGGASFSQSPCRSPIPFSSPVNQHISPDAVPNPSSSKQPGCVISRTDSNESRRQSLLPANHPMAKGWLGSSAPDEENLEHVRKGVIQGQDLLWGRSTGRIMLNHASGHPRPRSCHRFVHFRDAQGPHTMTTISSLHPEVSVH